MDCLSSEDLKEEKRNSLCATAYAESWCCQVGNVLGRATTLAGLLAGSSWAPDSPFFPGPLSANATLR